MSDKKRLYRNKNDKMIFGVCSGIADYVNVDPTLIRILWALLICFVGMGLLAYIICALVMPERPEFE